MKTTLFFSIAFVFFFLFNSYAQSQRTCGTMDVLQEMIDKDPSIKDRMQQLEIFTKKWVENHQLNKSTNSMAVITIPVVFHIVHFGEAVGSGSNISDAQILSQLDAMNEDFRLHNADSLQPTHPFWPYTADAQIEFCLAQRDPTGNPTTGILRYEGDQAGWTKTDIESTIKPQTIWNRDKYLNVWSLNFAAPDDGLLGYAQFPGTGSSTTDGVVIRYNALGYTGNVSPPFDNGRTGVHEVGHWLNLRHIWGDANCGDDLVNDTRPAQSPNNDCPSFPHNANSACGTDANGEMYMNYMDYVNDNCMVMFTFGQASRMQAALNGARSSLKTSTGCTPVGVEELAFLKSVAIYPNPSNGNFYIDFKNLKPESLIIEVVNLLGENIAVYKDIVRFPHEISLSHLPTGVYLIKLHDGRNKVAKKIIIER